MTMGFNIGFEPELTPENEFLLDLDPGPDQVTDTTQSVLRLAAGREVRADHEDALGAFQQIRPLHHNIMVLIFSDRFFQRFQNYSF